MISKNATDASIMAHNSKYYVVVQDKSNAQLNTKKAAKTSTIDYERILKHRSGESINLSEVLFDKPKNIYPEVRFKFLDDLDEPKVNASQVSESLEQSLVAEDTVIVLDLDEKGEKVVDCKCLSSDWQVYDIKMVKNKSIGQEISENRNVNNIIIKGTSSEVRLGGEDLDKKNRQTNDDLEDSVEKIRQMVKIFNERNKQLENMINLHSNGPL